MDEPVEKYYCFECNDCRHRVYEYDKNYSGIRCFTGECEGKYKLIILNHNPFEKEEKED